MKNFKITIKGKTEGDIDLAIDEVASQIKQGFTSGYNSNESGSYVFESEGEYETPEADPNNDEFVCEGCKKVLDIEDSVKVGGLYFCPICSGTESFT